MPLLAGVMISVVGEGVVWQMVATSGLTVRVVLVILLIFSLLSWAIILQKWAAFRHARKQMRRFLRAFRKARALPEVSAAADSFRPCPLVEVFESGYEEFARQFTGGGPRNIEAVTRALKAESTEQVTLLERRLGWLATTAGACPFIGLFGTVWGIIDAFQALGTEGAATLRAVAPGIAEALITTAAGLAAAIPALIAYNAYVNQVKEMAARTDEFALEFQNQAESQAASSGARQETALRG
ncbi:MAG: MotA/TolQ/ExbB proton channel family protein [Terriglobales bacterium]